MVAFAIEDGNRTAVEGANGHHGSPSWSIFFALLDIPHVVIDNSYGKISGFAKAWGTFGENRYFAQSLDEAISILKERQNLAI